MNNQEPTYLPYLSVAKVERILELAQSRNMSSVSTSLFAGYGFNQTDAALAVRFLKFLGAIDDDGNATSTMTDLQLQSTEKRKETFEKIVRDAYSILFDAVKDPYDLSSEELADEFKVRYHQTNRIIRTAIPVFMKLSEYAGLVEPGTVIAKVHKPHNKKVAQRKPEKKAAKEDLQKIDDSQGFHVQPIVKGKVSLIIPEDWNINTSIDDELNEVWRTAIKAALAYANKYEEKFVNDDNSTDPENSG